MNDDEKKFFDQFREMQKSALPSKTQVAAVGVGVVLINVICFVGAVGIIAYAVKWVIAS